MSEREKRTLGTTVGWQEVLARTEKDQGVPKKAVNEAFKAVESTIKILISELKPTGNETNTIKTPIMALGIEKIPKHYETDDKGRKFEISESIGIGVTVPISFVEMANEGFKLTRTAVKQ